MPFLSGFNYRKAIKIATAGIPSSSLTAFPKLFMIAGDTDIGGRLSSQKLAVTLADGTTQVPYGALYFNSSGGSAGLKIRAKLDLPSSLTNGDTIGYLYYDPTATDQSNKSGVLDSSTAGYWPLEETPTGSAGDMQDWSSAARHGTSANVASITGQVGNGIDVNGSSDQITVSAFNPVAGNSISVSCIIKPGVTSRGDLVAKWLNAGSTDDTFNLLYGLTAGKPQFFISNVSTMVSSNTGSNTMSTGTWYHVAGTYDGATVKVYLNGVLESSNSSSLTLPTGATRAVTFGDNSDGDGQFTGVIDEIFISSAARSADWIAYDYTDQFSNSSTFTLGAEETSGASGGPFPYFIDELSGGLCSLGMGL